VADEDLYGKQHPAPTSTEHAGEDRPEHVADSGTGTPAQDVSTPVQPGAPRAPLPTRAPAIGDDPSRETGLTTGSAPGAAAPSEQAGGATEPAAAASGAEDQIMTNLPHRRPQRRSARRPAARKPAAGTKSSRTTASAKAGRTSTKSAAARKGRTGAPEQREGLQHRLIGTALSTAAVPLKVSGALARRGLGLIERSIRRG
jgi:hypothetical protein